MLERLDGPALISLRSVTLISTSRLYRRGVIVSSVTCGIRPMQRRTTWGWIIAAMRQIPQQMFALRAAGGNRVGNTSVADARYLRIWKDWRPWQLRKILRDECSRVGARSIVGACAQRWLFGGAK